MKTKIWTFIKNFYDIKGNGHFIAVKLIVGNIMMAISYNIGHYTSYTKVGTILFSLAALYFLPFFINFFFELKKREGNAAPYRIYLFFIVVSLAILISLLINIVMRGMLGDASIFN